VVMIPDDEDPPAAATLRRWALCSSRRNHSERDLNSPGSHPAGGPEIWVKTRSRPHHLVLVSHARTRAADHDGRRVVARRLVKTGGVVVEAPPGSIETATLAEALLSAARPARGRANVSDKGPWVSVAADVAVDLGGRHPACPKRKTSRKKRSRHRKEPTEGPFVAHLIPNRFETSVSPGTAGAGAAAWMRASSGAQIVMLQDRFHSGTPCSKVARRGGRARRPSRHANRDREDPARTPGCPRRSPESLAG
jgi:hypothetical protein